MKNTETNRIENKEQLNDDFEQEVIAFLNYKEGGIIYVGINKNGQVAGVENTDLTQLQIANYLKCSQRAYSHYENGEREIPLSILIALADYYKVSLDYLVGRNFPKSK